MNALPRPEHPRPQFVRSEWMNLNGTWEFESDPGDSGLERGLRDRGLRDQVLVPFAPESALSGINVSDFHEAVWYRREISVPSDWVSHRVLLHFQAVDYDATVWVNGVEVGRHRGGFTPFSFDITEALDAQRGGVLLVRARDSRWGAQPRGKQATWYENTHAFYTRTTGIWQTVWLEGVSGVHLRRPRVLPRSDASGFTVAAPLSRNVAGYSVVAILSDDKGEVVSAIATTGSGMEVSCDLDIPQHRVRLWTLEDPYLYELRLQVLDPDGIVIDDVSSYAGLRTIAIDGRLMLLNGEPVFQRLVLDQGYWEESLMTAPSDSALIRDIELARDAGFNGARVHQKIAEERYLYHADRLGFLVWGEFADWGSAGQGPEGLNQRPTPAYLTQWSEAVERDISHPAIVGWCPLNETYQLLHDRITDLDDVTVGMYRMTKLIDPSRPVIDASGYAHRVPDTDIWDSHDYEQDPVKFAKNQSGLEEGRPFTNTLPDGRPYSLPYAGQPYMVSEFGGIWWAAKEDGATGEDQGDSWGYGERVRDLSAFYERFRGLVDVLLDSPNMFGYCYTQLTDVFQEQNGVYSFDRTPKFDIDEIRRIQTRSAAYERTSETQEVRPEIPVA